MPRLPSVVSKLNGPVSERIRVRRTTVLLLVLFVGLGALWLAVRTEATSSGQGGVFVEPKPGGGFTITRVPTTTTAHSTSTTRLPAPSTTRGPPTTGAVSPETTAPPGTSSPTTGPGLHSPAPSSTTTSTTVASHGAGGAGGSTG
jgi:hypothetical protein